MTDLPPKPKARAILDALRRGAVPREGLGALAVGLDRFESALASELDATAEGGAVFKALRGEYGGGKTFFSRWLCEKAQRAGFATSEVQISETETPLHRLETVYRRLMERLATEAASGGAFRSIVDGWLYVLEEDSLAGGDFDDENDPRLQEAVAELMEQRLADVSRRAPTFAAALRGYQRAMAGGDHEAAEGLLAWLAGQPNVGARVKREAGIKGDVDHFGALSFLQGLLVILKDSGHPGLVLVLDEVETLQRVRSDVRDKGLNALRQLVDEIDGGRFPGLYLLITGTPAFFEGPQGISRLEPLAQRLATDFQTNARFDNPRAPQIRLANFDLERLEEVGRRVRDIYVSWSERGDRVGALVDDDYVRDFASTVAGELGGKIGIAPRLYLKKLVGDVLDRVDQFDDFDPRRDYALKIDEGELGREEREARGGPSLDDIDIRVDP
jgi:BREX system ATP-binding protein BrxC/D